MTRFSGIIPIILMIVAQITMAGVTVLYKLAFNDGMKVTILVAYRFMFASAAIVPIALYFERNTRPKLTWKVIFQAFTIAFFGGSLAQNMYASGLVMTSATFVSALSNLIPALTFILAIVFRLEKFELRSWAFRAKVIGTLICLGGAMLLTLYKGVALKIWSTGSGSMHHGGGHVVTSHHSVVGPLVVIASAFSLALAIIFQAKISQIYPYPLSSTALICVLGALQSVVYALCVEKNNWNIWKLGANIKLITVVYAGVVTSGLTVVITMYCVKLRGPLFVSIFNPLMLILVAIMGSLFLDEILHLGSVVGALVIIVGLYVVLWGKGKERKQTIRLAPINLEERPSENQLQQAENDERENAENEEREINSLCNMVALGAVPSLLHSTSNRSRRASSSSVAHIDDGKLDLEEGISGELKNTTISGELKNAT